MPSQSPSSRDRPLIVDLQVIGILSDLGAFEMLFTPHSSKGHGTTSSPATWRDCFP